MILEKEKYDVLYNDYLQLLTYCFHIVKSTTFFIKNYGANKYMPIKTYSNNDKKYFSFLEFYKNKEIFNKKEYFDNFLLEKEQLQNELFLSELQKIERFYFDYYNESILAQKPIINEFNLFTKAIRKTFGGSLRKALYLSKFFIVNFSFTTNRFTTYFPEAFSTKDFYIFSACKFDEYVFFEKMTRYKFECDKLSFNYNCIPFFRFSKEEIIYNKLNSFLNISQDKRLFNLMIPKLFNLFELKSIQNDFIFFDLYKFVVKDRRKLLLDNSFLTYNVYKLHYFLLNKIVPHVSYNKGLIKTHPLLKLFVFLNLEEFSIKELDLLCFFINLFFMAGIKQNQTKFKLEAFLYKLDFILQNDLKNFLFYLNYLSEDTFDKLFSNLSFFFLNNKNLEHYHMEFFIKNTTNLSLFIHLKETELVNYKKEDFNKLGLSEVLFNLYYIALNKDLSFYILDFIETEKIEENCRLFILLLNGFSLFNLNIKYFLINLKKLKNKVSEKEFSILINFYLFIFEKSVSFYPRVFDIFRLIAEKIDKSYITTIEDIYINEYNLFDLFSNKNEDFFERDLNLLKEDLYYEEF